MNRLRKSILCVGAFLGIMAPLVANAPIWSQQVVLLMCISVLGIPHGALDHLVHMENTPERHEKGLLRSLPSFLGGYLVSMALYAALWWVSPLAGFLVFLAISAIHFAETDMLDDTDTDPVKKWMEHGFYGVLILSFLFIPHLPEIKNILASWSTLSYALAPLQEFGKALPFIPWSLLITWTIGQGLLKRDGSRRILLQTWVIACTVYTLPLLPAFTFYFALWHSSISLQAIHEHLKRKLHYTTRQMIIKAMPLSMISLSAIAALLWIGLIKFDFAHLLMGTLISISVLTLPHMAIMNGMYRRMSRLKHGNEDAEPILGDRCEKMNVRNIPASQHLA